MPKQNETYHEHVEKIETGLAPCAKKSFEAFSQKFVDGGSIQEYFQRQWSEESKQLKYANRTPLQLERDRILYSSCLRKQTEKYHVLFNGQRKIIRNYTTHTMRMSQVTRAICRGLRLNSDFAEAIAIGSKTGALPFIHASKEALSEWIKKKVLEADTKAAKDDPSKQPVAEQLEFLPANAKIPAWISQLRSARVIRQVQKYIPWAAGKEVDTAYSSGQQSYWVLSTNPFTVESHPSTFCPETMFGIWRHARGVKPEPGSFHHKLRVDLAGDGVHEIRWDHCTYEAIVGQYADDITWAIENLNDANNAAILNRKRSVYERLIDHIGDELPDSLRQPLTRNDSGGLYTFFISDFVKYSTEILNRLKDGAIGRVALREGQPNSLIGLSTEADLHLKQITDFLYEQVFTEPRTKNRTQMLKTVSVACADLLYNGAEEVLPRVIEEKAILERWPPAKLEKAKSLIPDPVHRIQLVVDMLSDMGDQELYDLVGIQAL